MHRLTRLVPSLFVAVVAACVFALPASSNGIPETRDRIGVFPTEQSFPANTAFRAGAAAEAPTVLFESGDGECVSDLYVVRSDGSTLRRLTRNRLSFAGRWSPDGRRVVFTRAEGCNGHDDFPNDVWVMNEDGSHARRLIHDGEQASFAPDGNRLAFLRYESVPGGYKGSLLIADATGKGVRVIATGLECCWEGSWSPDGSHYVYATGKFANRLWVVDVSTRSKRRVVGEEGDDVAWSPDGTKLAIARTSGLWVMRPDGTQKTQITSRGGREPAWAPDGTQIAFAQHQFPKTSTLLVTTLDGTVRQLARGVYTADPLEPAWSPDGLQVAFVMTRGRRTIWLVRSDGSGLHRLTSSFRGNFSDDHPQWQPRRS